MISFSRAVLTWGGTSSGYFFEAKVPGLSEYWNIKAESKQTSLNSERVS